MIEVGRGLGAMKRTRRDGFTLIELMIVMAVTVILLGAVFALNFRISGLWSGERARSELQQNFRFATDTITNRVREATNIVQPSAVEVGDSGGWSVMSDVLEFDYVPDPSDLSQSCFRFGFLPH
jgi:prepilin-type N-terminal cleavage/methylation domain-containing protein